MIRVPAFCCLAMLACGVEARAQHGVPARIRAAREIQVAAEVSGVVLERPVERNAMVGAGDVILRIDPTFLRIALRRAQATLRSARAESELAARELERTEELSRSGSMNRSDLDRAEAASAAAAAAVAAAEVAVEEAEERLARSEVRAPVAGLVSELHPEVGEMVGPERPVAELLTVQDLVAEAFLGPEEVVRVRPDARLTVSVTSPVALTLEGHVREVARAAGPRRTYRLVVALKDPPPALLAGFEARIVLPRVP